MQSQIQSPTHRDQSPKPWNPPKADLSVTTTVISLFLLLILAAALRLFQIDNLPPHGDELFTIRDAKTLVYSDISSYKGNPAAYAIVKELIGLGYTDLYTLRLPFVLIGIAGILATFWLARHFAGTKAALGASLLLTLHHSHLYISQEVRFYGLLYLFSALFLGFFWRTIHSSKSRWPFLAGLMLSAATLSQTIALILIPTTIGFVMVSKSTNKWTAKKIFTLLVGALPATIYLGIYVSTYASIPFSISSGENSWMVFGPKSFVLSLIWWISPSMVALMFVGMFGRGKQFTQGSLYNSLHVFFGVLILFLVSFKVQAFHRYFTPVFPAMVMLWGIGIQNCLDVLREKQILLWSLALVVLLPFLTLTASYFKDGGRLPWYEASRFLNKNVNANDVVIARHERILSYVNPSINSIELEKLDLTKPPKPSTWIVIPFGRTGISSGNYDKSQLLTWLGTHAHLVKEFRKPRYDAKIYEIRIYKASPDQQLNE